MDLKTVAVIQETEFFAVIFQSLKYKTKHLFRLF